MCNINTALERAVFLDRDGTLNEDVGYLYQWKDWQWLPDVIPGLKRLYHAGYKLIIISNQAGIARKYYEEKDLAKLNLQINRALAEHGIQMHGFYHCPHHPMFTGECSCRKPKPGMILRAAEELHVNIGASWLIGDKASDIYAGMAAGCKSILVETGYGAAQKQYIPAFIPAFKNFFCAVNYILEHQSYDISDNLECQGNY